ncbi:MAG: L,D-transpeptidase, partial [Shimia sp.]
MSDLTRRHFVITAGALFSAPIVGAGQVAAAPTSPRDMWPVWDAQVTPAGYVPGQTNPWGLERRFLPQRVMANDGLTVGDIHVDAIARYLYHIEEGGTAMRYGVA